MTHIAREMEMKARGDDLMTPQEQESMGRKVMIQRWVKVAGLPSSISCSLYYHLILVLGLCHCRDTYVNHHHASLPSRRGQGVQKGNEFL